MYNTIICTLQRNNVQY